MMPDPKKERKLLIMTAVVALVLPLLTLLFAQDLGGWGGHVVYLLTVSAFYALLMSCLSPRVLAWLVVAVLPFFIADCVYLVMARITPTMLWIFTMIVAEPDELRVTLGAVWPLILVVLVAMGWCVYKIGCNVRKELLFTPTVRRWTAVISAAWLLTAVTGYGVYARCGRMAAFDTALKISPIGDVYQGVRTIHALHMVRHGVRHSMEQVPVAETTAAEDELVVLVLGEASRYDNWSLNGYERETTPRLVARREQVVAYDSCFAAANLTTVAVPLIITPATPQERERILHEPAIVNYFASAGYQTAWIADQSFRNEFIETYTQCCDYVNYLSATAYDLELLQPITEYLNSHATRQMMVVHSIGSHFNYLDRYPEQYATYMPDMRQGWSEGSFRERLVNSYDNTIHYTDLFLDSLISTLEATGRPVVMLYSSDHGENLMDDGEWFVVHGPESDRVREYHVSFFAWASESYKARYPEVWEQLCEHRQQRTSTMNIFHTMLTLGHVQTDCYDATRSVASADFSPEKVTYRLDSNLRCKALDVTKR